MASRPLRIAGWVFGKLIYSVWVAAMIATPLFGFWVASSLAAYSNVSSWLALVIGLALFPIIPVGWELFGQWRRKRRGDETKPVLTRLDRLVLRTLIVNGLFLGVMFWRAPHVAFRALAVRGDWMLDNYEGPFATEARDALLGFADHFGHRWHREDARNGTSDTPPPPAPIPTIVQPKDPNGWPLEETPDPLVAAIAATDEVSVDSVGRYFASHITDKRQLAKALHDYVVTRLHYNKAAFDTITQHGDPATLPSEEPDAVFAARTGVCEGYAKLYAALGKAAGLEVAYITGYVRDDGRILKTGLATDDSIQKAYLEGFGHAWNAVKLDGQWALVDTTWDDPVGDTDVYRTTYLFTPPRVFASDHFPDAAGWQLLASPLGIGEFTRQPSVNPYIATLGVVLEDPKRSQVTTTDGQVAIKIGNPFHATVIAAVDDDQCVQDKAGDDALEATFRCAVPSGEHSIHLFGAPGKHESGQLRAFATILVNSR